MIHDIENLYVRRAATLAVALPGAIFMYAAMAVVSVIEAGKAFAYEWRANDAPFYWTALRECWKAR